MSADAKISLNRKADVISDDQVNSEQYAVIMWDGEVIRCMPLVCYQIEQWYEVYATSDAHQEALQEYEKWLEARDAELLK